MNEGANLLEDLKASTNAYEKYYNANFINHNDDDGIKYSQQFNAKPFFKKGIANSSNKTLQIEADNKKLIYNDTVNIIYKKLDELETEMKRINDQKNDKISEADLKVINRAYTKLLLQMNKIDNPSFGGCSSIDNSVPPKWFLNSLQEVIIFPLCYINNYYLSVIVKCLSYFRYNFLFSSHK